MIVEIWSDVVCPWCYIGKRRFEAALLRYEEETGDTVDVRYRPFMLDPKAPNEAQPIRQVYEKKFGGAEAADRVLDTVTSEAAGEGLDFRMDIAVRANTLAAHRLLVLAEREGCQLQLKERLMQAYFIEGADVGDHQRLIEYGAEVGLDPELSRAWLEDDSGRTEVATSLDFCVENGIASVPTYVFDRRVAVPGAQPVETFSRILQRVAETDGPAQLVDPT
ncbi:MAG: DsbA family oxidoreductase [Acidimicrobiales bacterium]